MGRIIAGAAGGLSLKSVPGDATRPTTDRVKEALFSRLESRDELDGSRVLDLYAGSGALGVEAASRGARAVVLVEQAPKAIGICQANASLVNKLLRSDTVTVRRGTVNTFLAAETETGRGWDLVFMDPPYPLTEDELATTLQSLVPLLNVGALVVLERSSRSPEPVWPDGLVAVSSKKYGETILWFAEPV
ncbi:16S rRNA (guanine(966)-N(2))-methyltransferase RsmD [Arthrobacter rhombi]|uniref:16S rRNA (guanine(966)-N(2))-methyltransferase RsmD n=1 Tax=Arthrobacter rhombi TaxID=71253 RepID=UPI0031D93590